MLTLRHFYIIRHGETEANAAEFMAGSLDSPLTANGRAQAQAAIRALENLSIPPASVIHSHLSRARDTASILNTYLGLPQHTLNHIAEQDVGEWEGIPYKQVQQIFRDGHNPPGGETHEQFRARVRDGINSILEDHPSPPLIVCHGGVFRAIGALYGLKIMGVQNCHLYEFEPAPKLESFPWRVWQYDLTGDRPARGPATVFQGQE